MTAASRYKGFSSFDALFSLVPLVMMVLFVMELSSHFSLDAQEQANRQQIFNRLVSIADYTVKSGAVKREGDVKYPNWIEPGMLGASYAEGLRVRAGLSSLEISVDEPREDFSMCIYRLVVIGKEKKPSRLFVCGD
jgi:hypothetical protein